MFSPTPLHNSAFEIEKRHGLRGLKTYIAPVWGFILLS